MVPNITSDSSFYGVIAYDKIKVDDGTAKGVMTSEDSGGHFRKYADRKLCAVV